MEMNLQQFHDKLARYCLATFGPDGSLSDLQRLSGGASMESWSFKHGDEQYILRRRPEGIAADGDGLHAISLASQADIIELAVTAGVSAPEVRGRLSPSDELGEGFIMCKVAGETLPHKILNQPQYAKAQARLAEQCARELAKIHAIAADELPSELAYFSPTQLIALQKAKYDHIGGAIPLFEFAFRWLHDNAPAPAAGKLVHGDFRMGNLMIDDEGIAAVLDWELARLGDPVQDIAYLCTPSWRFGHYQQVAGGFASADELLAAYAAQSGTAVDRALFRFWLVYSTLWWGVACMVMGQIWRDHGDRSIERAVIGRRVSEVEIDLALLFEEIFPPLAQIQLAWQPPVTSPVRGETSYGELLTALSEWNAEALLPKLSGHDKFQSRVAGNALGIAGRQAQWGEDFHQRSAARLAEIGYDHQQFCDGLANGAIDIHGPGIWNHIRLSALERLTIDQPKYAGLRVALDKWNDE